MKLGFPGPPVLMEKKNFLIALSFVAKVEMIRPLYSFCKVYGFSSLTCEIKTNVSHRACQNYVRLEQYPVRTFPGQRAHNSPRGWRQLMLSVGLLLIGGL
ncbi:hypothetical protein ACFX1X_038574 [Malus domestica]